MALTLYHAIPSANSERVKIVLHEKGLSYDDIRLNLSNREQKSAQFLKLNPYGKVPVISDDGLVLFESCIINEYLDEKYPSPRLMPDDPYLRGRARVLTDYGLNYIHEDYWALRTEMGRDSAERNRSAVEELSVRLRANLSYLNDALGRGPYFLGDFGLVDANLWPRLRRLELFGVLPGASLGGLTSWLESMKERPSVQSVIQLAAA